MCALMRLTVPRARKPAVKLKLTMEYLGIMSNKAFIANMLGEKKRLEDFPDRVDPNLVMHEPNVLPFGGTYKGLREFKQFYSKVREFYDFTTFELLGVYGDEEVVFSTARAIVAQTRARIYIAEEFKFAGSLLVGVRVYICDEPAPNIGNDPMRLRAAECLTASP